MQSEAALISKSRSFPRCAGQPYANGPCRVASNPIGKNFDRAPSLCDEKFNDISSIVMLQFFASAMVKLFMVHLDRGGSNASVLVGCPDTVSSPIIPQWSVPLIDQVNRYQPETARDTLCQVSDTFSLQFSSGKTRWRIRSQKATIERHSTPDKVEFECNALEASGSNKVAANRGSGE